MKFKPLDKTDYKPLYAQLSDRLKDYIIDNGLKPGDPFPSQNELRKYFDVSLMTIRFALQRLASDGVIVRIQGRGSFVADKKVSLAPNSFVPIEHQLAEQHIKVENELIEAFIAHAIDKRCRDLNLPLNSETFKVRRLKLIDGKPFCMEVNHLPPEFQHRFSKAEIASIPFLTLLNLSRETKISDVLYTFKSALLLKMDADFLKVPIDTPALFQERVFYHHDTPLLSGKLIYLGERVEISFKASLDKDQLVKSINITPSKQLLSV